MAGKLFGKKISKATKCMILLGAVLICITAYVTAAALYSDTGEQVTMKPFLKNLRTFLDNPRLLLNGKYLSSTLMISQCMFLLFYACLVLYILFRPNKYVRGKEYGSAEWEDARTVNAQIASLNPDRQNRVLYTREGQTDKLLRKVTERKKKWIK